MKDLDELFATRYPALASVPLDPARDPRHPGVTPC